MLSFKRVRLGLLQPLIQYTARATRETATLTQLIKPQDYHMPANLVTGGLWVVR